MDAILGFVCCFSVFGGIIWLGIRFLSGISDYIKSAISDKSRMTLAGKNRVAAGVSARKIGPASQLGQKVQLNYINSRGEHRSAFVDANTAHKHDDRVKVDLWGNGGTMNLVYERIKNPEVLGLISSNPVPESEPLPPDSPLNMCDNLIMTPHVAGLTIEAREELALSAANQILQVLRGERPPHLVNSEVWASAE